ncbi:type IX secretion system sortase PorU, partial [Mesonia sp.]|uniref:type IX secretion system sortase PorU n=1 Tax=Mesonia sp. TaxID=1960830 RepID=UPI001753D9A9
NDVGEDYEFSSGKSKARNLIYNYIKLNPIVKRNGIVKLIKSFSVRFKASSSVVNTNRQNNQAFGVNEITNSVFESGDWFKFYIERSGVYRITRSFLSSLGMDVSSVNPNNLKIVGHGGNMLPLLNNDNQYFDPPEISIKVIGGEDGSFDDGDYILFYGKAVDDEWNEDSQTNLNLYADRSYYYISTSGGVGNRVSEYDEPNGAVSEVITTFDDYQYYEVDDYNIGNLGRRWLGDRFDFQNERSYNFDFPNLVQSEPVVIKVYGVASSESSTNMTFSLNSAELGTLNFTSITDNDTYGRGLGGTYQSNLSNDEFEVSVSYDNNGNPASVAYLDYINVTAKRNLIAVNTQFEFKNLEAAQSSGVAEYQISNAQNISEVWDITDNTQVSSISNSESLNNFSFKSVMGEERKFIALASADFYTPRRESNARIPNINLKGNVFGYNGSAQSVDYIMITSDLLISQASRLAQYRAERDGLNIKVVLLDDIYQEFNSGKQDISAIRNFIKYVYDNNPANSTLRYVCFFGDASVDYKDRISGNNNIVPTYQSLNGFSASSSSAASDDFYGFMDANEGDFSNDLLDLAVGRILADSPAKAKVLVDKILAYESKDSYGSWRNNFVLISDDADESGSSGYGLQVQLDQIGDNISENKPFINVKKIHSDAYQQISSAGGSRYPEVNEAITEAVEVGASVVNYFGHGGENGLAAERIITVEDMLSWQNTNKYNLFVTVTCEFTRFDNPERISPGEYNLLNDNGGSVAMVTTTRSIPVSTGTNFNNLIAPYLFNYEGGDDSVAEAVRKAKNVIDGEAKRVIFYFGDPAMKLQLAEPQVRLTTINDVPFSQATDTLKALSYVKLGGQVQDQNGNLLSNYNGDLATTIFDKRIDRNTLNNDGSGVFDFTTLGEIIFRGNASVNNGLFEFDFIVPKDITISVGEGRVSFYAERDNVLEDQRGFDNSILVGGINEDAPEDNLGPEIQLFMNDESFVSGGITNDEPFLLAKLSDENGINTASGIGHDLVAILDGDETNPYVVNDYYETELDDYTRGTVNYKLRDLEEGLHTLSFKAWDVYNNSSTAEIQFRVTSDSDLKIERVLNYPNPFHNYTEFWFNHNRPYEPLEVQVQVFTVSGKIVWTRNQTITTDGFLAREITWDGKDDFGQSIGKGVYVYKLTVKSKLTNKKAEKFEKLVIL